jgi:hypothetical protein
MFFPRLIKKEMGKHFTVMQDMTQALLLRSQCSLRYRAAGRI